MSDFDAEITSRLRSRAYQSIDRFLAIKQRFIAVLMVAMIAVGAWGFWHADRSSRVEPTARASSERAETNATAAPERATTTSSVPLMVVYVAGAVATPGVYSVADGSRVGDVVKAAGGLTPEADLDRVNLAAKVTDGQKVYLVRLGQSAPPDAGGTGAGGASTNEVPTGPVNLNTATASQLDALPGVGPATADAIIQYRTRSGPFESVGDLTKVKGIGPAKLDALKDLVAVS